MSLALKRPTLGQLIDHLQAQGLLDEAARVQIVAHANLRSARHGEPWFVQALLAAGAWIAAICFIICLGIAGFLDGGESALIAWGAVFIIAAAMLRNLTSHIFPTQLALAVSAAGHGFLLAGAGMLFESVASVAVTALLLCLVLYPVYRDALHRFLSCLLASGCMTAWIMMDGVGELLHVMMLAKILAIGLVFMYRNDLTWLRPLGYAMALSVPVNLFLVVLPETAAEMHWWPANVVLAGALVWLYQWVAGGWENLRKEPLIVAVVATIGLAAVTTPGVLAAIGLMVLGYARRDMLLLAMGIAFFPAFIVVFYYELQTSLLTKSYILMASGAVLLAAREFLNRRGWANLEAAV